MAGDPFPNYYTCKCGPKGIFDCFPRGRWPDFQPLLDTNHKAMLMALMDIIERKFIGPNYDMKTFFTHVDTETTGVTKEQLETFWQWNGHIYNDLRKAIAEKAEKESVRKRALDKLTPEEREALGVQ